MRKYTEALCQTSIPPEKLFVDGALQYNEAHVFQKALSRNVLKKLTQSPKESFSNDRCQAGVKYCYHITGTFLQQTQQSIRPQQLICHRGQYQRISLSGYC